MNKRIWQCLVRNWEMPVCGILLLLLLVLHFTSLRHKGLTTDESLHYHYGDRVLHSSPRRTGVTDSSTMPFSALPVITSQSLAILANHSGLSVNKSWIAQIERGRYATIVLSLILAAYIFTWSYQLYGRHAALLSLGLYVFDPNFLAHGQLVTADLPAALMITIALYHFWQFLKLGGKERALLSATTLGLSQLAKYSCVYLYPIFLVTAATYGSATTRAKLVMSSWRDNFIYSLRRFSLLTAVFAGVSILIINLGFGFDGFGTPLSKYTFKDAFFKTIQTTPIIADVPLPLPVPYVQGLDLCKFEERLGRGWGNIYMAGELRINHHDGALHGFPGYYFYAALFKVPIATQFIFLVALFGHFRRRDEAAKILRREEVFLLLPMLAYWLYFNFFFNAQIGIRHVLPVFALGLIFCGRFLAEPESKLRNYAAVVLASWVVVSTLSYYPHFISYFNEFVSDRKLAYRHLADSNLDWRGNEWYLAEYIRHHPDTIIDPRKPVAGRIVVPVNALVGVNRDPEQYQWLREHFEPVDHIAHSFLVFDVPNEMPLQGRTEGNGPAGSPQPSPQH
jgi:dolichyl-phosphate-mannose-protein mannosyltransferase